jgi:hypothetical protein
MREDRARCARDRAPRPGSPWKGPRVSRGGDGTCSEESSPETANTSRGRSANSLDRDTCPRQRWTSRLFVASSASSSPSTSCPTRPSAPFSPTLADGRRWRSPSSLRQGSATPPRSRRTRGSHGTSRFLLHQFWSSLQGIQESPEYRVTLEKIFSWVRRFPRWVYEIHRALLAFWQAGRDELFGAGRRAPLYRRGRSDRGAQHPHKGSEEPGVQPCGLRDARS